MRKRKKKPARSENTGPRSRWWWTGCLALVAAAAGIGLLYGQKVAGDPQLAPTHLVGRWQRPDGGYVLELAGIGPQGAVDASYFNPRPINVSRSRWQTKEGRLELFVELRDVHYPGSTYALTYRGEKDRLVGVYYQAALRQSFAVEFVRIQ